MKPPYMVSVGLGTPKRDRFRGRIATNGLSAPESIAENNLVRASWFPLAVTIFFFLLLASALNFQILGYNLTGWAWMAGFGAAWITFIQLHRKPALPIRIWLPWLILVVAYSLSGLPHSYQSAAQIICAAIVGLAASVLRPSQTELKEFAKWLRWVGVVFLAVLVLVRLPMLLSGHLPDRTGLAPEAISSLVFQAYFLCAYLTHRRRVDLVLYLAMTGVPVVAMVRGPILGTLAILCLNFAPLAAWYRLAVLLVAIVAGLSLFHTDRVQRKMFHSGSGTLADVRWGNPDLATSGREPMWRALWEGVEERPWFGHGGNADAAELIRNGFRLHLPHNDWLRVLFNYGAIGCALYALTMLLQMGHGLKAARESPPEVRVLFLAAVSAFVPYMVLMFTDNILIYAQYFGNVHFLILGLAYGGWAAAQEREDQSAPRNAPDDTDTSSIEAPPLRRIPRRKAL